MKDRYQNTCNIVKSCQYIWILSLIHMEVHIRTTNVLDWVLITRSCCLSNGYVSIYWGYCNLGSVNIDFCCYVIVFYLWGEYINKFLWFVRSFSSFKHHFNSLYECTNINKTMIQTFRQVSSKVLVSLTFIVICGFTQSCLELLFEIHLQKGIRNLFKRGLIFPTMIIME